jgi:hypothetical protein
MGNSIKTSNVMSHTTTHTNAFPQKRKYYRTWKAGGLAQVRSCRNFFEHVTYRTERFFIVFYKLYFLCPTLLTLSRPPMMKYTVKKIGRKLHHL